MPRRPEQYEVIREKSRKKILAAALELFAYKGYAGTSIDSIAKKAGISKGLIYNYYPGKKKILHAIFEDAIADGISTFTPHLSIPDPYERMRRVIEELFTMMKTRTEFIKLFSALALQPGVIDDTKGMSAKIQKTNSQFLSALNKETQIVDETGGLLLDALLDGVVMNYLRLGKKYPLEKVKERIISDYCTPPKKNKGPGQVDLKKKL